MLRVDNISKTFNPGTVNEKTALDRLSLHLAPGDFVTIIGSNGAGKSSMMNAISGLVKYQSGEIRFKGEPLSTTANKVVKAGICQVPEGRLIFANLSVYDNLRVGAYLRSDKSGIERDMKRVYEIFPRLEERKNQIAGTLSGGEQQMLAVGRALMARPTLLCMDEPSLGLAPIIIDELFDKIVQLNEKRGQTILIVEQNAFLALEVAKRAYILKTGQFIREDTAENLLHDPTVQQEYLGADA